MALISILFLYLGIGVLAAIGTTTITRSRFSPAAERRFFTLLLLPVAAIYLAFVAYFDAPSALRSELIGILFFVLLGLLGLRFPVAIMAGYLLHGGWDLVHEVGMRGAGSASLALTSIPLAYGVFCAAYDWYIAVYLLRQRQQFAS
jgi:hypothetical protein